MYTLPRACICPTNDVQRIMRLQVQHFVKVYVADRKCLIWVVFHVTTLSINQKALDSGGVVLLMPCCKILDNQRK